MIEPVDCPLCGALQAKKERPSAVHLVYLFDCPACKTFFISRTCLLGVPSWDNRTWISFRTASRAVRGEAPPVLTWEGIDEMDDDNPLAHKPWIEVRQICKGDPPDVVIRMDQVLLTLAARLERPGRQIKIRGSDEPYSFWTEDWTTLRFYFDALAKQGLLKGAKPSEPELTIDGWIKAAEIQRGYGFEGGPPKVFVAMWFDESMRSVYDEAIDKAIRATGHEPFRVDIKEHNNRIDDEIIAGIRGSRFVVADFTCGQDGVRGGVYYEAGYAHGLGREVIFCVREDQINQLHFDTEHFNHIPWKDAKDLQRKLELRILATVGCAPGWRARQ